MKKILAICLTAIMVMSVPMVAMAKDAVKVAGESGEITVEAPQDTESTTNDNRYEGIMSWNQQNDVVVTAGDISINGTCKNYMEAISVIDNGTSKVTMHVDNIKVTNNMESRWSETGIYVDNNERRYPHENANDVTITAKNIDVNTVDTDKTAYGIYSNSAFNANVNIQVDGNINSTGTGISAEAEANGNNTNVIVVDGIVHGDEVAIEFGENKDKVDVSVYGLTTSENGTLGNDEDLKEVNYIIKGNNGTSDYANMTFDTSNLSVATIGDKTYYTAKQDTYVTVTVSNGYKIQSTVDASKIGNTYKVKIPAGGMVTIEAIYDAIQKNTGSTYTSMPTSQGSSSAPITSGGWSGTDGKWSYVINGQKLVNCTAWITSTDANGQTVTGKYCFDNNGHALVNTWKEVSDGVWNYYGADGRMLTNTTTPDGYVVDANGEWRK